ncbi:hypothetical protein GTY54_10840, partial [Streptomyces sp. SID625]|nr:hypothetical protein [Streptomyces sp. SID625]
MPDGAQDRAPDAGTDETRPPVRADETMQLNVGALRGRLPARLRPADRRAPGPDAGPPRADPGGE